MASQLTMKQTLFLPRYCFFKEVTVSDILEWFWSLFCPCSQEHLFHCKISDIIFPIFKITTCTKQTLCPNCWFPMVFGNKQKIFLRLIIFLKNQKSIFSCLLFIIKDVKKTLLFWGYLWSVLFLHLFSYFVCISFSMKIRNINNI